MEDIRTTGRTMKFPEGNGDERCRQRSGCRTSKSQCLAHGCHRCFLSRREWVGQLCRSIAATTLLAACPSHRECGRLAGNERIGGGGRGFVLYSQLYIILIRICQSVATQTATQPIGYAERIDRAASRSDRPGVKPKVVTILPL